MVTFRNIITVSVIVLFSTIAFFWLFQSDEAKIKKRFKTIAELSSKGSDEHELTAALSARKIGDMFADTCRVEVPSYNISRTYANENIPPHVLGIRSRYSQISLKFHDLDIHFPEEGIARVMSTAFMEAVWYSGEPVREVHEIVCWLKAFEKDWFFYQIKVVSVLEK